MNFLLTNDDGVNAPGLAALAKALTPLASVTVLAPHTHLSGCSHQATTNRPMQLTELRPGWYMLDGSPVDCVRIGLIHLGQPFDWVVSGINDGGNLGADVYLSGTVAGAREACLLGTPSIAVSQYVRQRPVDWNAAGAMTRHVLEKLLARKLPPQRLWNVNLPDSGSTADDVKKFAMPPIVECAVDPHPLPVAYELQDGKLHYKASYHDRKRLTDCDIAHCFGGAIAVSEITL